ncbi:MAG: Flagella basal body P-ring formation protein FlgA [Candidatus Gallionella acididurans]|uniref:Flagella basal body P-ring formation protein FlgA n=1 Tax=Candidatus Gallionella acididurans TaxID=1796491 RepID=A0A139BXW5_9PROT|nr:MAG: Flagella basal body P-ring formation protein FlgA [Candidatus Gallionella acididurans]
MCTMKKLFLILCMAVQSTQVFAVAEDHQVLRETVIAFVQRQTAALPGKASFHVEEIDPRLTLPQCEKLEVFLPSGSQLLGKTSIGVRCAENHGWSIFVSAQIKISVDLLISARQLSAGHTLHQEDLATRTIEITQAGGMTDPNQVTGKVLRYSITAGQILREDMLRAPFSVMQGQNVQLIVQGIEFVIRSAGVALSNASEGQYVKVRNVSGGVVSGVARAGGVVEIAP